MKSQQVISSYFSHQADLRPILFIFILTDPKNSSMSKKKKLGDNSEEKTPLLTGRNVEENRDLGGRPSAFDRLG